MGSKPHSHSIVLAKCATFHKSKACPSVSAVSFFLVFGHWAIGNSSLEIWRSPKIEKKKKHNHVGRESRPVRPFPSLRRLKCLTTRPNCCAASFSCKTIRQISKSDSRLRFIWQASLKRLCSRKRHASCCSTLQTRSFVRQPRLKHRGKIDNFSPQKKLDSFGCAFQYTGFRGSETLVCCA